jgi:predicted RecB family nuclease
MLSKITGEIVDALQHCRLKAYLLFRGEQGTQSGYEKLQIEQQARLQSMVIAKIRREYGASGLVTDLKLSIAELRKGPSFVLGAQLECDRHEVHFDALRKIEGSSALGDFRYEPVLFCATPRVLALDRKKLAAHAVLLAMLQGALPIGGTVYLGCNGAKTSIRYGSALAMAESILRDAERLQRTETPPKLRLNDHCRICAFRNRCHDQAIREDNLSLLRGIGEKAIKRYARKGILTLTQLAHTFRPRRRGKRADTPLVRRDHSLHALAIRDRTIYVLGTPTIPTAQVRIYVDMEGIPETGLIYLIGLIVRDGERIERYSFWAETSENGEAEIFTKFLNTVAQYSAPRLYSYGNYERVAILRMRRHVRRKKPVDSVLAGLTNVLTIIYPHFYFPTYSNGLKEIASWLGYSWTEPDVSGMNSVVWRANWERTGDVSWKDKLIQYNMEDCDALQRVCNFLTEAPNCSAEGQNDKTPHVASVAQLDQLARTATWSKFVQADFEFVNKRAYFDYQQRHVFVRTKPSRRKRSTHKGIRRWQNRDLRLLTG